MQLRILVSGIVLILSLPVRAPLEQEGYLLAGVLLNTIGGRLIEPQKIELDYELVIRKSCGAGVRK